MNLWFLWEIAVNAIESFLVYYLYSKVLGVKSGKNFWALLGMIALIIIVCTLNYINIEMVLSTPGGFQIYIPRIAVAISTILYCNIFFKGSLSQKIIWGLVPTIISLVADAGTQLFASIISTADLDAATQLGTERFPLTVSYLLIALLIYLVLANIPKAKTGLSIPLFLRLFMFVILFLGIIVVDQLIDISFRASQSGDVALSNQLIFVNISFLIIALATFILIEYVGKLTQKNIDSELEVQKARIEQSHYAELEVALDQIMEAKHDIKHHLGVLDHLLLSEEYEEAKNYFSEISSRYDNDINIVLTPNPTINALLSNKLHAAKTEKISFRYVINNLETLPAQHMDICSILGNLIDNAIEACVQIPEPEKRFIDLLIENRKQMLIIRVENSYDGTLLRKESHFLSRKAENGHGIGLKHVERLVRKHFGNISICPEQYKFIVTVLLPLE